MNNAAKQGKFCSLIYIVNVHKQIMSLYLKFFECIYQIDAVKTGDGAWQYLDIPPDVKSILDIGCGRGDFLNSLSDKYEKFGIDICKEPLRHVKSDSAVGSIDSIPFGDRSFDMVTCFEVLEHLSWDIFPKAISELERISRKYIALSVPNRQNLAQALVACPKCLCRFNADWHVRSFEPRDIASLFNSFSMVEIKECGPHTEDYPFFYDIFSCLLKRPLTAHALCPQCGFSEEQKTASYCSVNRDNGMTKENAGIIKLFKLPVKLLRVNKRPYWLLSLFVRKAL